MIAPIITSLLAPQSLFSISTAMCFLYLSQIPETAEAKKTSRPRIKPKLHDQYLALNLGIFVNKNRGEFDAKKFKAESGLDISPKQFTWLAGIEFEHQDQPNLFKNNILTYYTLFHHLKTLSGILDNCDFKKYPDIAEETLTHRDINKKNLLNHVCRSRGVIGDNLTKKIVDIYVDSLDKKALLSAVDKFIFTLPEEQFLKIANKIGRENLTKNFSGKLSSKKIKAEISKYHSPHLLMKKSGDGYEKNTLLIQQIISDPLELIEKIKAGFGVQISQEIAEKMQSQHGFSIADRPNVYITSGDTLFGIIADKHTYKTLSAQDQQKASKIFQNVTILENFLANLKSCKKHISPTSESQSQPSISKNPATKIQQASLEIKGKETRKTSKMKSAREL